VYVIEYASAALGVQVAVFVDELYDSVVDTVPELLVSVKPIVPD
jgi:hypothetical protein